MTNVIAILMWVAIFWIWLDQTCNYRGSNEIPYLTYLIAAIASVLKIAVEVSWLFSEHEPDLGLSGFVLALAIIAKVLDMIAEREEAEDESNRIMKKIESQDE